MVSNFRYSISNFTEEKNDYFILFPTCTLINFVSNCVAQPLLKGENLHFSGNTVLNLVFSSGILRYFEKKNMYGIAVFFISLTVTNIDLTISLIVWRRQLQTSTFHTFIGIYNWTLCILLVVFMATLTRVRIGGSFSRLDASLIKSVCTKV